MLKPLAVLGFCILATDMCLAQAATDSCSALAKVSLPTAKILSSEMVAAGAFIIPGNPPIGDDEKGLYRGTPAFCRVTLMDTPSSDSRIPIEVWLPATGWNGKFRGQGNGGFAGTIDYAGLAAAVTQGYAAGATDTGHQANGIDAAWAIGHPEKVKDFGYRAVHEMTVKSKALVAAYYTKPASYTYFSSCSDGGREALMEAQRFPEDYNGIVAGSPANYWTHLLTAALYNAQATTSDEKSFIPPTKLPAIEAAALAACDQDDGLKDGVIGDPRTCRFKPASMICKGEENDSCLTAPQAHTLELLYGGAHDESGKSVFPGYLPGSETGPGGWAPWITGPAPRKSALFGFAYGYYADMVYENAAWDYRTARIDDSLKLAMAKTADALDSNNPDLKPFLSRGGKLILYHGWNDPAIPAENTVNYYYAMRKATGDKLADSSVRLYMIPGMQHCLGGPGATSIDQFSLPAKELPNDTTHNVNLAIEAWVEKGVAPTQFIAAKFDQNAEPHHVLMTRPLCIYPKVARYKGTGDQNDAANFACVNPGK